MQTNGKQTHKKQIGNLTTIATSDQPDSISVV